MKPIDVVNHLLDEVATAPRRSVGIEQVSKPRPEAFEEPDLGKADVGDRVFFEYEPGDMDFGTVTKVVDDQLHFDWTNKSSDPSSVSRNDASYIVRWRVGGKVYNNLGRVVSA